MIHNNKQNISVEKNLTEDKQHFRNVCDSVPAVFWMSDADGNCVFVNKNWVEFTGKTFNQALGNNWLDLVHPEDREFTETMLMTSFSAREEYSVEFLHCRSDGEYRWILDNGVPRYTSNGLFVGFIGSCIDITERKQEEYLARKSTIRYDSLVHSSPVGIFYTNAQGKCSYVNERWSSITGLTITDALGSGWERAIHPKDRERIVSEWHTAQRKQQLFKCTYRLMHPDGRITWVYGQTSLEKEPETEKVIGYVGTITDITEQKEMEQSLLYQQAELCHVQRLIIGGKLAGDMAHELNQPLGAIANYVEGSIIRYRNELDANPELVDVLKHILKLTERTRMIIKGLRALIRKQNSERLLVNINALIRESIQLIDIEVERRSSKIMLDLAPDIQMLWGDRTQLQQLLVNAIINGLEAMETVTTTARILIIQTRTVDQVIEIRVIDSGIGFCEEKADSLFKPFVTTKSKGVGLGLTICRVIAEVHGGEISIDLSSSQGTTFRITLPMERRRLERYRA